MTGPLRVRAQEAEAMAAEWDALADQLGACPFVRPGWLLPWNRAWAPRRRLVLLAAYRADTLVGVLPLNVRRGVTSSPTNWHTAEYGVLAEDGAVAQALWAAAVDRNRRRLRLGFVDDETAEQVGRLAARAGCPVLSRELTSGPYIDLKTTFADYESGLDGRLRSDLRRRRRRLDELGEVTVEVHAEAEPELLEDFFRVEAAGWKGNEGTAIAAQPRTRRFYSDVASWAAGRGWLRLALLRLSGRAIAGDLAFQADGAHYLLKTGFDPEYRRYAPGKLLRREMIERAYTGGLRSYEFLGTDDPWKLEWTTTVRRRLMVEVFARTWRGRADRVLHEYGRPAAKVVLAHGRERLQGREGRRRG